MKTRKKASQSAIVLVELLIVSLIVGLWGAAVATAHGNRRGMADHNACAATRHTLAGALEAHNLAHNARHTDLGTVIPKLVQEGLLARLPEDPGTRSAESWRHFWFDGRDVACTLHRGPAPAAPDALKADVPAFGLPLLMLAYAIARFRTGYRPPRRTAPLPIPVDELTPEDLMPDSAPLIRCDFCHEVIAEGAPIEEDGRVFHEECGSFYREKLLDVDRASR